MSGLSGLTASGRGRSGRLWLVVAGRVVGGRMPVMSMHGCCLKERIVLADMVNDFDHMLAGLRRAADVFGGLSGWSASSPAVEAVIARNHRALVFELVDDGVCDYVAARLATPDDTGDGFVTVNGVEYRYDPNVEVAALLDDGDASVWLPVLVGERLDH